MSQRYLNIGPHSRMIVRTAQQVLSRSDLPSSQHRGALATVLQYAYGAAAMDVRWIEQSRNAGMTPDELFARVSRDLAEREGGEVPDAERDVDVAAMRERDFSHALDCLIAGVEKLAQRDGAAPH
ncbi:hypothetical protein H4W79_001147 [Nocardiopsis terrae]|uniref:Tetracycline repressor TetR C-terminal domain-containing protein n=1 Tax=Nocardiopsis terrae TaxID=372655 RepID=A0ABR9HD24_9ACTN|nr:hypothetical protein [Nocardiopsis terrae]